MKEEDKKVGVKAKPGECCISARIIRKDGSVENLGVISRSKVGFGFLRKIKKKFGFMRDEC